MIATRFILLGGEGCPAADISKPAENRNIFDVLEGATMQVQDGLSRTVQEQTDAAGTPLAQQPEFLTVLCSEFEARVDPDHWPSMRVLFYLQMPVLPAPLKPMALAAIDELQREVRQGR